MEADNTGQTLREYIWLDDLPLAVVADVDTMTPKLWFVHADHLNRPVRMTDGTKAVVWDAAYKPFGEVHSITGSASNNLRFPGQYFLLESGLHYNWHRHYDPTLGRYLQPDPLGFVDGPSIYAYARTNPTQYVDPEGEKAKGLRNILKDVHFEGPNEKFKKTGVGRICQIRYKNFRIGLDYQEFERGKGPELHLNIGPAGATRHISLSPGRLWSKWSGNDN